MIRAVFFDLFGTLVHLPGGSRSYLNVCRTLGQPRRLRASQSVNAPSLADFCRALGEEPPPEIALLTAELNAEVQSAELFTDALPVLSQFKERGFKLGLISNLASSYRAVVAALGIEEYFEALIYSCDIGVCKPDAAIYQHALQELAVMPHEAVMVGDSLKSDFCGASDCGINAVLLDRKQAKKDVLSIATLAKLASVVESLSRGVD